MNKLEKEIVKNYVARYNNDIHKEINFNLLSESELNFLIAIFSNITENKKNNTTHFTIESFKKMLRIKWNISESEIKEQYIKVFNKLNGARIVKKDKDNFFTCNIFSHFGYRKNKENKTEFYYKLTDMFNYIFSNIQKRYTQIYLNEFISVKGIYAKRLYEYLAKYNNDFNSQFRTIQQWREILNIPQTYLDNNLTTQIFKPCLKELQKTETFKDLNLNKNFTNKKLTSLGFSWSKQKTIAKVNNGFINIDNYETMLKSELLNNLIERKINESQFLQQSKEINKKITYLKDKDKKESEQPKEQNLNNNLKFFGIVKQYGNKKDGFTNTRKEIIQAPNRESAKKIYDSLHPELKNYTFKVSTPIKTDNIKEFIKKYNFEIHYYNNKE